MQDKFKAKKIANTSTFLESVTKVKYLGTTLISLQSFMKKLGEHWTQVAPDCIGPIPSSLVLWYPEIWKLEYAEP